MSTWPNALPRPVTVRDYAAAAAIAVVSVAVVALITADPVWLLALFCAGMLALAIFKFDWFVYAQIFFLPWYPLLDLKLPLRDVSLVLRFLLLVGVWFYRRRYRRPAREWLWGSRSKIAILVFAAIATVSLLISAAGPNVDALRSLLRFYSYLALFFAIAGWVRGREQLQRIIVVLLFSGVAVALFGLYQVYDRGYTDLYFHLYPGQQDGLEPWNGRITSFLFHFNSLAGYLNLLLPLSFAGVLLARTAALRYGALITQALLGAALYFTGSRGGLLAYGGASLLMLVFMGRRWRALLCLLLAVALSLAIIFPVQRESAAERLREVDEFTSYTRVALWSAAAVMFLEHPVLGVGYGNYRTLYTDYIPGWLAADAEQIDAHNIYLQFLS